MPATDSPDRRQISALTWNVHQWIGSGGRPRPGRTAEVIRGLAPGLAGLQEAVLPIRLPDKGWYGTDDLARDTGLEVVPGPTLSRGRGPFGNLLLTRYPVVFTRRHDLSVGSREPRGVLDAMVDAGGFRVRVVVTHLGLGGAERRKQVGRLLDILESGQTERVVLMGDFNVWLPFSRTLGEINSWFGSIMAPRTFPARFPLLRLDRIWVRPGRAMRGCRARSSPEIRRTSDHLPVAADIEFGLARS
jgi:endonuclease/exonuclease/phosphatase family metal-dependent hydrolase